MGQLLWLIQADKVTLRSERSRVLILMIVNKGNCQMLHHILYNISLPLEYLVYIGIYQYNKNI